MIGNEMVGEASPRIDVGTLVVDHFSVGPGTWDGDATLIILFYLTDPSSFIVHTLIFPSFHYHTHTSFTSSLSLHN